MEFMQGTPLTSLYRYKCEGIMDLCPITFTHLPRNSTGRNAESGAYLTHTQGHPLTCTDFTRKYLEGETQLVHYVRRS